MVVFLSILALALLGILGWWVGITMHGVWMKKDRPRKLSVRIFTTIYTVLLACFCVAMVVILGTLVHNARTEDNYSWQVQDSTSKCVTLQQVHNYHGHQHILSTRTICP